MNSLHRFSEHQDTFLSDQIDFMFLHQFNGFFCFRHYKQTKPPESIHQMALLLNPSGEIYI